MKQSVNSYKNGPDKDGFFDIYGGRFVAETLMPLILDLEKEYNAAKKDKEFIKTTNLNADEVFLLAKNNVEEYLRY